MVNGYQAKSLEDALDLRAKGGVIPYGGGTDLMIEADENAVYLFLNKVAELKQITKVDNYLHIGSGVTFTEILESPLAPAILKEAVSKIAAPAIRNVGTAGGNICNGSAKADSALIFFVTDAKLRLAGKDGERVMPIRDFYLGRKRLDLREDEILTEILIPTEGLENYYYKKIGARNALAISRVSFAGILNLKDGVIDRCATAFGAVSDVIIRRPDLDLLLTGKTLKEAKEVKEAYLKAFDEAIVPIRGRVSAEYRKRVCMNLLKDFLDVNGI